MWEFLARQLLNGLLKKAGDKIGGKFFNDEANGPEAYADRIKRDFHLGDYADASALYDSDRAYWEKYYRPLPDPDWKKVFVRDSIGAAGIPGGGNVFEYGYPDSNSAYPMRGEPPRPVSSPQMGIGRESGNLPSPSIFDTGALSIPFTPPNSQGRLGGLPSMLPSFAGISSSNPLQPALPQESGGLRGLMREYLRNDPEQDR
jgi:hypothetical protein